MFRYIALAWDDTVPQQAAAAEHLNVAVKADPRWHTALHRRGLYVHVTGVAPRSNGIYTLPDDKGVVLGKLFRRTDQPWARDVVLTTDEADNIARTGGRSLVRDFWGRYVAFLYSGAGPIQILRDPSGTLPCFTVQHEGVCIVHSWLEDVLSGPVHLPAPEVNWPGLAGHLLYGELGGRETALDGVFQVLPGEAIEVGTPFVHSELLWDAVDIARSPIDDEADDPAPHLRHEVRRCARAWTAGYDRILFRLSGGVDSSILLSCLASGQVPADVTCVSYHSAGSNSDERPYARLSAAHAGRDLIERERDATFKLENILGVARTAGPINHVGRMNARMDAELAAAHGATALFTGAGGDALFYEFSTWWAAADYLRIRGPDRGFFAAVMDAARLGRVSVWQAISSAVVQRARPTSPWLDVHSHLPLVGTIAWDMAAQHERFVHPTLRHLGDLPIGKATQVLSLVHPVPYYDPFQLDAAPETVNPLLSQPLVEMCLRCPTWVLTRGGRGRALARRAFAGDLPPEIAGRRSKGGMEEHIQAVLKRDIHFARSLLLDGELVRRGLLDRARVETILSGRPTTLASHTGRLHVYLGIEAWLTHWSANAHQTAH